MTIYSYLPRHNDDTFRPAVYAAAVALLAATFSADDLRAAIAASRASRDRNDGVEFDDTRSRHKTGKAITALTAALALKETR